MFPGKDRILQEYVAGYIRVSTEMQREKDSIVNQEIHIKNFAAKLKMPCRIYKDVAISAKDTDRPAFQELCSDIEKGLIHTVVVTKLDRITRSLKDLIELKDFFEEYNVEFVSITQSIDTSSPMGRFSFYVLGLVAQLEREMIAERVAEDMRMRAQRKKWNGGPPPFGFRQIPGEKNIEICKPEAGIVETIYQLYLERKSIRGVANTLNSMKLTTKKGNAWTTTSVRRILQNPVYYGALTYNKRESRGKTYKLRPKEEHIIVEGVYDPIISKETFQRVQRVLDEQRTVPSKTKSSPFLLSGLVKCSICGGNMHGGSSTSGSKTKPKKHRYYQCNNNRRKGKSICPGMSINAAMLDNVIEQELKKLSLTPSILDKATKDYRRQYTEQIEPLQNSISKVKEEECKIEQQKERLFELYETEVITKSEFVQRKKTLDERLSMLSQEEERVRQRLESTDLTAIDLEGTIKSIQNLADIYEELEFRDRQELLRNIISSIVVERHNVKLNLFIYPQIFVDRKRAVMHAVIIITPIVDSGPFYLYVVVYAVSYSLDQPVLGQCGNLANCA